MLYQLSHHVPLYIGLNLVSAFFLCATGLYLGIKLFLLDYLFMRFPRFKMKYDSSYRMWQQLPTDAEYEKRSMKFEIDRVREPQACQC